RGADRAAGRASADDQRHPRRRRRPHRAGRDRRGARDVMTVIEADAVRERPRTPAPAPRPQRAAGAGADGLFLLPAVRFVAVTVVYPLVYSVLQAFQDVGLREVIRGGADWVGLANFADQFGRPEFWQALWLSLVYTVGTVALSYAGGLALALLFLREFPGRNLMRALLLLAWILPTVVGANLWRWMLDGSYGLLHAALPGHGVELRAVRDDPAGRRAAERAGGAVRGSPHRRRVGLAAVPAHHAARAPARQHHRDAVDLHLRLQDLRHHLPDDQGRPGRGDA